MILDMQDQLATMCRRVMRHTKGLRLDTAIPRVGLGVSYRPSTPVVAEYQPMVCLVLQGAKQVMIGDQVLRYDPASYFIASLELPATGSIIKATPEKPYVAVSLTFDRDAIAELLATCPKAPERSMVGFAVTPITRELLTAWDNLLALLDAPADVPVLAPLREREVLYRLLPGPPERHAPADRARRQPPLADPAGGPVDPGAFP